MNLVYSIFHYFKMSVTDISFSCQQYQSAYRTVVVGNWVGSAELGRLEAGFRGGCSTTGASADGHVQGFER
jgi:hypothetical protein